MSRNLNDIRIINVIKERKNDIFFRGEDHLVYQENKIIKLKNTELKYDKDFKYIKPKSFNQRFWEGFIGWRYLFKHFY